MVVIAVLLNVLRILMIIFNTKRFSLYFTYVVLLSDQRSTSKPPRLGVHIIYFTRKFGSYLSPCSPLCYNKVAALLTPSLGNFLPVKFFFGKSCRKKLVNFLFLRWVELISIPTNRENQNLETPKWKINKHFFVTLYKTS